MKIKSLSLNNFAGYNSITASFDENITLLIGSNGAGKSTLGLNAVWFLFQGIAEKASNGAIPLQGERFRFIGPNAPTSKNEMVLVDELHGNAEIKVIRKLTKTGSELSFVAPEGYPHTLDQAWLNSLFNIFLIAPKRFVELSGQEQALALGINTKAFDDKLVKLKTEYTGLNAVYKSYGEITPVEKIEKVDVAALQEKKKTLDTDLFEQMKVNRQKNKATMDAWKLKCQAQQLENQQFNNQQDKLQQNISMAKDWSEGLGDMGCPTTEVDKWIDAQRLLIEPLKRLDADYPPAPLTEEEIEAGAMIAPGATVLLKEMPDKTELLAIEKQISEAFENNLKEQQYQDYLVKKKAKDDKAAEILKNKEDQKAQETAKVEYIKRFKFPFTNLTVDDAGGLLLAGRPIHSAYYSTGELLKVVPILISTTKPELKYIFLQDFNLLDATKQKDVMDFLTGKGFQLVIEMVGDKKVDGKTSILLRDNGIVETYEDEPAGEDLEA